MIRGPLALFDIESSQVDALRDCKVELRTSHGRSVISDRQDSEHDGDLIEFANQKIALPVKRRYSSPLIIALSSSHLGLKQKTIAEAVIWLMDIPDHARKRLHVPGKPTDDTGSSPWADSKLPLTVYRTKNFARLEQNYWTPIDFEDSPAGDCNYHTSDSHSETLRCAREKMQERALEQVATLSLDLAIEPGLSSAHKKMTRKDPRQRVVMEGFDWALMSGLRNDPATADDSEQSDHYQDSRDWEETGGQDEREDGDRNLEEFLSTKRTDAGLRGYTDSPSTSYNSRNGSVGGQGHTRQSSYASRRSGKSKSVSDMGSGEAETEKGWRDRYHDWKVRQVSIHLQWGGTAHLMRPSIPAQSPSPESWSDAKPKNPKCHLDSVRYVTSP